MRLRDLQLFAAMRSAVVNLLCRKRLLEGPLDTGAFASEALRLSHPDAFAGFATICGNGDASYGYVCEIGSHLQQTVYEGGRVFWSSVGFGKVGWLRLHCFEEDGTSAHAACGVGCARTPHAARRTPHAARRTPHAVAASCCAIVAPAPSRCPLPLRRAAARRLAHTLATIPPASLAACRATVCHVAASASPASLAAAPLSSMHLTSEEDL